jgi:hypothetical protein
VTFVAASAEILGGARTAVRGRKRVEVGGVTVGSLVHRSGLLRSPMIGRVASADLERDERGQCRGANEHRDDGRASPEGLPELESHDVIGGVEPAQTVPVANRRPGGPDYRQHDVAVLELFPDFLAPLAPCVEVVPET